ncbi:MAG: NAD-dependent epimerase/dehydratase [Microgenomates group bacterium GW2011_GWC1_39_12]|nr:MAG: NAD-dependent epimerase/dehydratase [Microgenomates group bacterium GW2011_GWC1_39_12]
MKNAHVLVTGGLGFIGSSLVLTLVKRGAIVTIIDNMSPSQGGNLFNIYPVQNKVTVNYSDIRDVSSINQLVQDKDYIFHLARQTDHIISQTDPFPDIDINIKGTAILLEACKKCNPNVCFINVGTRGQYGTAIRLPVAEDAPTNPKGIYELTNLAAEKMVKIYHDNFGIRSIMLRLTNIYGPRSQMKTNHYGVVNWFIRQAIDGEKISVFGDGLLRRDFLYIDDTIDAMVRCVVTKACYGEVINIGHDNPDTFIDLVKTIVFVAGKKASYQFTPFSKERKAQEPGDFASDITKIKKLTGWKPTTSLREGITKTILYYRSHKKEYWS